MKKAVQKGFTLVEIAIVLLIVTILLGYTVALYPVQQELKQYRQLKSEMDSIVAHLIGFAQVNGRLPCPDTNSDVNLTGILGGPPDGQEDPDDIIFNADNTVGADGFFDSCKGFSGFLPAVTLGMNGDIDPNGRLLDPWGQPYRYHVSNVNRNDTGGGVDLNAATGAAIDLVSPDGIGEEGLSNVTPNISVCTDSNNADASDTVCDISGIAVIANAAAVIISTGKDRGLIASNIQDENRDDFQDGTNDFVYTSSTRNDSAGSEYDDLVRWISPNLLYSKMIEAGQLP
ncbi:MAG: type II secretion system protein [Gammaproteobacteria bacterium]|nr:type II secretion system protein [Gammaproteobacteria bacterium]